MANVHAIRTADISCQLLIDQNMTLFHGGLFPTVIMSAEMLAPRDVTTTLNYCASATTDGQFPYYHADETPEGVPRSNMLSNTCPVVIHDARGREEVWGLDVSGFLFARYPSVEKDFVDEEKIQTVYYAQCEEILKQCAGAKRVIIFNHTIRRSPNAQTAFKALDPAVSIVLLVSGSSPANCSISSIVFCPCGQDEIHGRTVCQGSSGGRGRKTDERTLSRHQRLEVSSISPSYQPLMSRTHNFMQADR